MFQSKQSEKCNLHREYQDRIEISHFKNILIDKNHYWSRHGLKFGEEFKYQYSQFRISKDFSWTQRRDSRKENGTRNIETLKKLKSSTKKKLDTMNEMELSSKKRTNSGCKKCKMNNKIYENRNRRKGKSSNLWRSKRTEIGMKQVIAMRRKNRKKLRINHQRSIRVKGFEVTHFIRVTRTSPKTISKNMSINFHRRIYKNKLKHDSLQKLPVNEENHLRMKLISQEIIFKFHHISFLSTAQDNFYHHSTVAQVLFYNVVNFQDHFQRVYRKGFLSTTEDNFTHLSSIVHGLFYSVGFQDDIQRVYRKKRQLVPQRTSTSPICSLIFCNLFNWNTRRPSTNVQSSQGSQVSSHQYNFWRYVFPLVRWPFQSYWSTGQGHSPMWTLFMPTFSTGYVNPQYGSYNGQGMSHGSQIFSNFGYNNGNGLSHGNGMSGNTASGGDNPHSQMGSGTNQGSNQPTGNDSNNPGQNSMGRPSSEQNNMGKPPTQQNHNDKPSQQTTTNSPFMTRTMLPNTMTTEGSYKTTYATEVNTMNAAQTSITSTHTTNSNSKPLVNNTTSRPGPMKNNLTTIKPQSTTMKSTLETTTKTCNKTKTNEKKTQHGLNELKQNISQTIKEEKNLTNMWLSSEVDKLKEKWNKTVTSVVGPKGNAQVGITGMRDNIQQDWWGGQTPYPGLAQEPSVNNSFHSNVSGSHGNGMVVNHSIPNNASGFQGNAQTTFSNKTKEYSEEFSQLFILPNQFNFTKDGMNFMVPLWWNMSQYDPGFGAGLFVTTTQKQQPAFTRGQNGAG